MRTLRLVSASTLAVIASLSLTACERTAEQLRRPLPIKAPPTARTVCRAPRGAISIFQGKLWRRRAWSAGPCSAPKRSALLQMRSTTNSWRRARRRGRAAGRQQDSADFDLEAATSTLGGDVGGPVSPPPHGSSAASRSARRCRPSTPQRPDVLRIREVAGASARGPRFANRAGPPNRPPQQQPTHHRCITRGIAGSRAAGDHTNTQSDRADAGLRGVRQPDDSRDPDPSARRPASHGGLQSTVAGRFARPLGRRHARGGDHQPHGPHRASA